MVATINTGALKNLISSKGRYVLIDVRDKEELENGVIPTSVNIPLSELEVAFDLSERTFLEKYGFQKMKKEDNLIFYCRTGSRSETASGIAVLRGFKSVKNYKGSIWAWSKIDKNVKKYGNPPFEVSS